MIVIFSKKGEKRVIFGQVSTIMLTKLKEIVEKYNKVKSKTVSEETMKL